MALKVSASDGVKVYNVSSGKTVPQWLSEGKKKSLKKDDEYRRRLELIQDFEFPAAAHRLKATQDGAFIYATGIHPPRVRCFELSQLSLKFERHLDSEIVDFEVLSEDYSKVVFLCADRSVAFHAKFGAYFRTRIPKFGRDLAYHPYNADLLVAGSSNEIYRINLEEGRFLESLPSNSSGINKLGVSPAHGLVGAAGEEGLLECYDLRQERCAGRFDAASAAGAAGEPLTALRFDESGLTCAVGTGKGVVALYDLRSSKPMLVKDHMYSSPIVDLKFKEADGGSGFSGKSIVSADKHIVRVWEANSGKGITSVQPPNGGINDVLLWKDSGLLMLACESPKLLAYFIPSLGPAPKWCSFLENLTEELEETANSTVYDDYRFVTRQELEGLGLSHLVGSSLLRAYMHGYFIHNKLWQKAKAIAAPVDYASVRKERIQSKLEAERAQRITLKRRLPKVNAMYAAKIMADTGELDDGLPSKRAKPASKSVLADERFQGMFEDPAFTIDQGAEEYKVLHPNAESKRNKKLVEEHFEAVESDAEGSGQEEDGSEDGSDDEDLEAGASKPGSRGAGGGAPPRSDRDGGGRGGRGRGRQRSGPQMMAARSGDAAKAFQRKESLSALHSLPLAERAEKAVLNHGKGGFRIGGQKEMSFTPRGGGGGRGRSRGRGGGSEGGMSPARGRGDGGGRVSTGFRGGSSGSRGRSSGGRGRTGGRGGAPGGRGGRGGGGRSRGGSRGGRSGGRGR